MPSEIDSSSPWGSYLPLLPPPSPLAGFGSTHPSARLPIELWREIFNFATEIPRGYDSTLSSPFEYSEVHTGHVAFQRHLNSAHKIKQNLRLVSRKIGAIVQELIFEYLFLRDVDGSGSKFNWYALAPGLEESKEKEEKSGRRGAGWYVKRLEIFTHVSLPRRLMNEEICPGYVDKVDAAARILRCCPNVRMLALGMHMPDDVNMGLFWEDEDDEDMNEIDVIAAPGGAVGADVIAIVNENANMEQQQQHGAIAGQNNDPVEITVNDFIPYPVFHALFHNYDKLGRNISCLHLQRLEWTSDIVPATNLLFTYLPSLPSLESFYVNLVHSYYPTPSAGNLTLQNLHTLEIVSPEADPSSLLNLISTWKLDKLMKFGLTTSSEMSNPLPFFKAHGSKFEIFDFSFLGTHTGPVLLRHCTTLTDMITHLRWAPLHMRRLEHKNVKRIGIRGAHFRDAEHISDDVTHLFACFNLFLSPLVQVTEDAEEVYTQFFTTINGSIDANTLFTNDSNADMNNPSSSSQSSKTSPFAITAPIPQKLRPQHFPSLHTIRLLDFSQSLFKERKWRSADVVMWAFWVRRFERLSVRLEDHEGKLIKVVFSEFNVLLPGDEPRWWRYR